MPDDLSQPAAAYQTKPTQKSVSNDDDLLICVNPQDDIIGYKKKGACHDGDGTLHRALSVFLLNAEGEILLQQRSHHKRLWPGFWANSCCSHPRRGESTDAAAQRRVQEELGVTVPLMFTHNFIYHARYNNEGSEHELCSVFVGRHHGPVHVHAWEVAKTRWLSPRALDAALADQAAPYTPWLRLEWSALKARFAHLLTP